MKNPNGYGTIKHLSGARRRPFAFVVTEQGRRRVVSCHATRTEALIAQADYLRRADRPRVKEMTFSELYARWLPVHIARHEVSRSAVNGYRSSFQHCRPLWELPLSKIKYAHVQGVLDAMQSSGLSYSSRKKCRSLINLCFAFARQNEYAGQNFHGLLWLGKNKPVRPHRAFTRQKINRLWRSGSPAAETVLMLIYTGLRVSEMLSLRKTDVNLKQKTINITRSKTASGVRVVPIHPLIFPFVLRRMRGAGQWLISVDGGPVSYSAYRRIWEAAMREINGAYTPHDARHTFASLLDGAEVNDNARKRLLGHAGGNVTDGVYTHKTLRQLRAAIESIK